MATSWPWSRDVAEPVGWQASEIWARQKVGQGCLMCADAHLDENPFSLKIADLPVSIARLVRNQYMPGWTVVVLRRHACELFDLSSDELTDFWSEAASVARAVQAVYAPVKINYGVFGNLCPHIHCHVVPRFAGEDPRRPLNMGEQDVQLTEAEYAQRLTALRQALQAGD
jgi:diadenosine tetraphosphate (Ap4A) HIT family hydrolase